MPFRLPLFPAKPKRSRRIPATKAYVKRIVSGAVEHKWGPQSLNITSSPTPTVYSLTNIAQGDADTQRDGDRVKLLSIRLRWQAIGHATSNNNLRLIVFQWKPDTVPVYGDILYDTTAAYVPISPYYHDNQPMFKVLYDKRFSLNALASANGNSYKIGSCLIKSRKLNKIIQFQAGTTVGTNKIYAVLFGADPTNTASFQLYSDVTFTN